MRHQDGRLKPTRSRPRSPGGSVPEKGSLRKSWWVADSLKAEEVKGKAGMSTPAPAPPPPRLDTSHRRPRRPNGALQTPGCQERVLTLKIDLHRAHAVLRLEILPLFYNDSDRDFGEIPPAAKKSR